MENLEDFRNQVLNVYEQCLVTGTSKKVCVGASRLCDNYQFDEDKLKENYEQVYSFLKSLRISSEEESFNNLLVLESGNCWGNSSDLDCLCALASALHLIEFSKNGNQGVLNFNIVIKNKMLLEEKKQEATLRKNNFTVVENPQVTDFKKSLNFIYEDCLNYNNNDNIRVVTGRMGNKIIFDVEKLESHYGDILQLLQTLEIREEKFTFDRLAYLHKNICWTRAKAVMGKLFALARAVDILKFKKESSRMTAREMISPEIEVINSTIMEEPFSFRNYVLSIVKDCMVYNGHTGPVREGKMHNNVSLYFSKKKLLEYKEEIIEIFHNLAIDESEFNFNDLKVLNDGTYWTYSDFDASYLLALANASRLIFSKYTIINSHDYVEKNLITFETSLYQTNSIFKRSLK